MLRSHRIQANSLGTGARHA